MSARWDQEPMMMNLKPIRDMRWDTDPAEMARKLERKLNYSQKVNAALETQLQDSNRRNAELAVALVLARKPRPSWGERCRKAVRKALRSRRTRGLLWGAYFGAGCYLLLLGCVALAKMAFSWGWAG